LIDINPFITHYIDNKAIILAQPISIDKQDVTKRRFQIEEKYALSASTPDKEILCMIRIWGICYRK